MGIPQVLMLGASAAQGMMQASAARAQAEAEYNDRRLDFMRSLRHWKTFKNGWTRRVNDVTHQATKWAKNPVTVADKHEGPVVAKASGAQSIFELVKRAMNNIDTLPSIGGMLSGLAGLAATSGPIQWAAAFALVAGVSTAVYLVVRESG